MHSPASKSEIKELRERIAELEAALEAARSQQTAAPERSRESSTSEAPTQVNNLISRLTQRDWQLNSNAEGQFKFFGPTSSVHLTESISISLLDSYGEGAFHKDDFTIAHLDLEAQTHLLDIYSQFQHTVLQVFQMDTFLKGLQQKQPKYASKALIYCVFANAARISPRPDLKAMVLPSNEDDFGDDLPYLLAKATQYTEEELKRPRITTIQSLLLLSVLYSALGKDTKGWLLTGNACRLAVDLGIHKNNGMRLPPGSVSVEDIQERQLAFWACVVFDRFWGLYLGRPFCLHTEDLPAQEARWMAVNNSWEAKMAYAWVSLLVIVGNVCDVLNADVRAYGKLEELDRKLQSWRSDLDPALQYHKGCPPSVSSLNLQYSAAMILLHQPTARFGSRPEDPLDRSAHSRRQCITFATAMASCLQDFQQQHGDVTALSGIALHSISLAATTLVASIAEKKSADALSELHSLKACVRALGELETTYIVARRVRKIVQLIIRVCHIETDYVESQQRHIPVSATTTSPHSLVDKSFLDVVVIDDPLPSQPQYPTDTDFPDETLLSGYSPFAFDGHLPMSAQFDIFHTFDAEALLGPDPFSQVNQRRWDSEL